MRRYISQTAVVAVVLWMGVLCGQDGAQIVQESGIKGGVVVHLGCGDGKRTAGLRVNDGFTVHGLDADAGKVAAARTQVLATGLYGKIVFDTYDGTHLPYIDNMVNLLVVEEGAFTRTVCARRTVR